MSSSGGLGRAESEQQESDNGVKGLQDQKGGALQVVGHDAVVRLNVGGTLHQVRRSTLMSHPDTLLGRIFAPGSDLALPDVVDGGFFFDRNPAWFPHILDVYRTERLCGIPKDDNGAFPQELTFWGFDNTVVPPRAHNALEVAATCLEREQKIVEEFVTSFLNMQPGTVLGDAADEGVSCVELVLCCTRFASKNTSSCFGETSLPGFIRDPPRILLNPSLEEALCASLQANGLTAQFSSLLRYDAIGVVRFCYYCDDEDGAYVGARCIQFATNSFARMIPDGILFDRPAENPWFRFEATNVRVLTIGWTEALKNLRKPSG